MSSSNSRERYGIHNESSSLLDFCLPSLPSQMIPKIHAASAVQSTEQSTSACLPNLPTEILCMIVDELEIGDRVSLALAAKYFAQIVVLRGTTFSATSYGAYCEWIDVMGRLENWMPDAYRRCHGRSNSVWDVSFRPANPTYWLEKFQAGKQGHQKSVGGLVAWKWQQAARDPDAFLKVVYDWAGNDPRKGLQCPRCYVKSMERQTRLESEGRADWQIASKIECLKGDRV